MTITEKLHLIDEMNRRNSERLKRWANMVTKIKGQRVAYVNDKGPAGSLQSRRENDFGDKMEVDNG